MSLDLGALIGRVVLEDAEFQVKVRRVSAQFAQLGGQAGQAAAGTGRLDESLAATGASADKAAVGVGRAAKAETDAAAAAARHAAATARVTETMAGLVGTSTRVQVATLRQVAAEDRNIAVQAKATATTRELAGAQAGLISATARAKAAQEAAATSTSRWRTALAGTVRTAAGLGLAFGAFEAVKKAIDITKEAAAYQRDMVMIRTLTGASASEMRGMGSALLGLAGPVGQAPEKLAVSLYHIESVGLRGRDALNAVKIAAEGAAVGQGNLEDTTNALTATIASGIVKGNNFASTMSTILSIVGAGDMKLQDFNESLSSGVLTVVAQYGATMRDFGAAMATFGDSNIRGAHAATIFRMAVQGLATPAKQGADTLQRLGLTQNTLAVDMQRGGVAAAITDLRDRLKAAGVTGHQTGQILTEAFGKRAGVGIAVLVGEYDRLQQKYGAMDQATDNFGAKWQATQRTTGFALQRIGAELDAAGVSIATNLLPGVNTLVSTLGRDIPAAMSLLGHAAGPAFGVLGSTLRTMWTLGGDVVHVLGPLGHVLGGAVGPALNLGAAIGGAYVAFRLMTGIVERGGLIDSIALRVMYAQNAVLGLGTSAKTAASRFITGNAAMAASADATASEIVIAGGVAETGWRAALGPLAAIAVGAALLVSLFHRSSTAARTSTDAVNAYGDALKAASKADLFDAITKQLNTADVPAQLAAINTGLGHTAISGKQFVDAIQAGGRPLADMRTRLQGIIDSGSHLSEHLGQRAAVWTMTPAAQAATKALAQLNVQYNSLTAAARQDLQQTKAWAGVSASIDKVSQSTRVGSDTAKQYAAMMGIVVDKNGVAAVTSRTLTTAVTTVARAYSTATGTGSGFLKSLSDFAQSSATAADRAALIGSTLVAANGDALAFAGAMNGSATAVHQLGVDVHQAASQVGKGGESTRAWLRSVVDLKRGTIDYSKSAAAPLITDLQQIQTAGMNAAQAMYQHARATMSGRDAADAAYKVYVGQTRGSLIDQLQRLGANRSEAKRLADQYLGMPSRVKTLIEQQGADPIVTVLNKIGLQLSFLTGHPWTPKITADTETLKQQIVDAQRRVDNIKQGRVPNVRLNDGPFRTSLDADKAYLAELKDKQVNIWLTTHQATVYRNSDPGSANTLGSISGNAAGTGAGVLPHGVAAVGEAGPELAVTDRRGTAILSNRDSRKFLTLTGMKAPGFAAGSGSLLQLVERAGFRGRAADIMAAIVMAESGGNARAYNGNAGTGDNSYGLAQINMLGSMGAARRREFHLSSNSALFDPLTNLRVAYALSGHGSNFTPWTTYTRGLYRRYLGTNAAVAGGSSSGGSSGGGGASSAAQAANQRLSTAVGNASTAISAVNGIPAGSRFAVDTFNQATFTGQVAAARHAIELARAAGASAATIRNLTLRLAELTREGARYAAALRTGVAAQIRGLATALANPTAGALSTAIATVNAALRRTGASARTISQVARAEQQLTAVRGNLLHATSQLAAMRTYRAGVGTTLFGQFDPTQAGSVTDLEAGLRGAGGSARAFGAEIAHARAMGLDRRFLAQLIAAGPNTTLGTLGSASRDQVAAINRDLATYRSTVGTAADAAVMSQYGISISGQQSIADRYQLEGDLALSRMAAAIGKFAETKFEITLDGHVLATSVLGSREFAAELHQIATQLARGRNVTRR